MKFLRFLLIFLTAGFIFSACQKELSAESGTARGSLKEDLSGDCMPVLINGTYQKDTLLNSSNYIDIQLDIAETGIYTINTDTVNGYSFSNSGSFAVTGLNTIRLIGSGKPLVPGIDVFLIRFDTSVCEVNIIVSGTGPGSPNAVFTLAGAPGNCTGAVPAGTYMQGLPTTGSNTVTINVNVTQTGLYNITTGSAVNGVSFSAMGSFATTGPNNVTLTASGTPAAAGTFAYPVNAATGNCGFNITYLASAPPAGYTLDCSAPVFAGNYQQGVPMTSANTVTVAVTVVTGGPYSITSNTVNGVSFSGSGILPATPASQTVTLTASGTPVTNGTFSYTLTGNATTCNISATYGAPGIVTADVDGVPLTFNVNANAAYDAMAVPGYNVLFMGGDRAATGSELIGFGIGKPGAGTVTPGTYDVNQGPATIVLANYTSPAAVNYIAASNPPTVQPTPFTIIITSITATRVIGTFSGPLKDNNGAGPGVKNITNGTFDLPIQ